jgi:hypothetical protein
LRERLKPKAKTRCLAHLVALSFGLRPKTSRRAPWRLGGEVLKIKTGKILVSQSNLVKCKGFRAFFCIGMVVEPFYAFVKQQPSSIIIEGRNLFGIIGYLQKQAGVELHVTQGRVE